MPINCALWRNLCIYPGFHDISKIESVTNSKQTVLVFFNQNDHKTTFLSEDVVLLLHKMLFSSYFQ